MTHLVRIPRKLIETALPLDAINAACSREKSIRHGHPSTLHLYWARRPLAAARAVLFSQLVNDPSAKYEYDEKYKGQELPPNIKGTIAASRKRLFQLITELVQWENTTNESVLQRAREEIQESWSDTCALNQDHPEAATLFDPEKHPAFHDPFAGGGALPLEAQRLGLEAWASDLNPVAVLINKAMIEIPPKFAGRAPVGPVPDSDNRTTMDVKSWKGAAGLAEDVRRYGHWMREEAFKRIGHLYPKVEITPEIVAKRPDLKGYLGQKLTVIAWLWARTVKSPDPRFAHVDVPLVSSFVLSKKEGKGAWVEPVVEGDSYRFEVRVGKPPKEAEAGTKTARGANFRCLISGATIGSDYTKQEGIAKRIGETLLAVVCEGDRGRVYLSPDLIPTLTKDLEVVWRPESSLPDDPRNFWTINYGLTTWGDLFTSRQLVALNTFCDLVAEVRSTIQADAVKAGMEDNGVGLDAGGQGAKAYGEAIALYLSFVIDKCTDYWSAICTWHSTRELIRNTFGRQAIPMTWDYAETNPFSDSAGNVSSGIEWANKVLCALPIAKKSFAVQFAAQSQSISTNKVISTDPPYYDNIAYADLSDFFYVWLRRSLRDIYPEVCGTLATPKAEELVATPYRHEGKERAEAFFLNGMTQAMTNLAQKGHPGHLTTIYYAFKQSESTDGSTSSTGWSTFLGAVIHSGFQITGTWPLRTELGNRMIGSGTNALASSIVLVCRRRSPEAPSCTRADFQRELSEVLPAKLHVMVFGVAGDSEPIHPADLAQAAIGPGIGIFSQYAKILKQDGQDLTVREALEMINTEIGRFFNEGASDLDRDSRFCLTWYQSHAYESGPYGDAQVLAQAKGSSVDGLVDAGVLVSSGGKARLLRTEEYPADWDPTTDHRTPVWEFVHQLVRALRAGGKNAAGDLFKHLGGKNRPARQLAYQLYTLAEQAGRADEARAWNELIGAWEDIETVAHSKRASQERLGI